MMKNKSRIKIGFVVGELNFGGGERVLNMLMSYFNEKGHDISIFTWNKEWKNLENIYDINILKNYPKGIVGKLHSYSELKVTLMKIKVDVLIVFSIGFAEVAVWSARSANTPIILSERVDPHFSPKRKIRRLYKKILFKYANGVVFQTKDVEHYYKNYLNNNSVIIHNPIIDDDLPKIDHIVRKEIVVVARLSSEKRIDLLIECFSEINNNGYKLIIYGDGPEKQNLQDLINNYNCNDKIVLKGKVDRVIDEINGADIYVMCSEMEGMPNALIEALAMNLACISTDFPSGGARELIRNNYNGILIGVNNKVELKNALKNLISDNELKTKLKQNAINIRKTHNKDVIMPQWEKFIFQLIKK